MSDSTVPLTLYSRALDEIYELRRALAYEASVREADLTLKSFPKSRRDIAERAVSRMRGAARGRVVLAYAARSSEVMRAALREAQASETLTRHEWEEGLPGAAAGGEQP